MIPSWLPLLVIAVCGAVVPGPCSYAPDPAFDCSSGDPCGENLACVIVDEENDRGFCRSADTACDDQTLLCAVPGLDRSGLCVEESALQSSITHCGACFARCRGGAACNDGVCDEVLAEGECLVERGNFDCKAGQGCDDGACVDGAAGDKGTLEPCSDGAECDGGLCIDGICSRPCDFGCPPGTRCDVDAVAGGLCVTAPDEGCFEG